MSSLVCEECGGKLVIVDGGQIVCSSCGLVKGYISIEVRFHKSGSPTYGNPIGSNLSDFRTGLGRLNKRIQSWSGFSIPYRIRQSIEAAARRAGVPTSIIERAKVLYLKSLKRIRGSQMRINLYSLGAAALLTAIWEADNVSPLTIEEMTEIYKELGHRVSSRSLARAVSIVKRFSDVKPSPSMLLKKYIVRITSVLLSQEPIKIRLRKQRNFRRKKVSVDYYKSMIVEEAIILLNKLPLRLRLGKNPYVVAAALVYIAEQQVAKRLEIKPALSQKYVARYTGISEYSIRDNSIVLMRALGFYTSIESTSE